MAVVWGEAEVILHTDGRALPGEVRRATTAAATEGGKNFQRKFNAEMRKAGLGAVREFAAPFTRALSRLITNSRAFTVLSRQARMLRTDMRILGNYAKGQFTDAMNNVRTGVQNAIQPFREFRQEVGERSRKATEELREGLTHLRITGDDLRKTFPGVTRAVERLRAVATSTAEPFKRLGDRFALIRQSMSDNRTGILDLRSAMENLRIDTLKANEAFDSTSTSLGKMDSGLKNSTKNTKSFFGGWKRLPHGFRQFTVWTAAILSAFEQMAVLGSAAGGGLFVVLGALTQLGIGAGATIAVFQDLTEDLEDLPTWLRPAAEAFQGIGTAFGELQDSIQKTALKDAVADFDTIADIVRELIPAFQPLAEVIGNAIGGLAEGLKPGTDAFRDLDTLIRNSAPTFETFLDTAGKLGGALLDAFANPVTQKAIDGFMGWIEDLVDAFSDFVESDEFGQWMQNTIDVLGDFGGLLEGVGEVLNNLVDQEAVDRTRDMLQSLTDSLPGIQAMLETLGALDVFGILAQAIETVFLALKPLFDLITPFVGLISEGLILAMERATVIFQAAELGLLPLKVLFELFAIAIGAVIEWLTPLHDAFKEVGDAMQEASETIWEALQPAFETIKDAIVEMLPSPEEFERFLRDDLIPTIQDFAYWVETDVVPAIEDFAHWLKDEGVPAAQAIWEFIRDKLIPIFEKIGGAVDTALTAFGLFSSGVTGMVNAIAGPLADAISWFQSLFGWAQSANNEASKGGGGGGGGFVRPMATGGLLNGPTRILAGEAGPEAIVPLRRPLSQVDPSVRALSAMAQGMTPHMASGGVVGGGKSVTVQSGAIVVSGVRNEYAAANIVLNSLVERVVG